MRAWTILALALAATLPVTQAWAQYANSTTTTTTSSTQGMVSDQGTFSLAQGTFVSHRQRSGNLPETVTIQYNYQGSPLTATYLVKGGERWMSNGQRINWAQAQPGQVVQVPSKARLANLSFNGPSGVGTVAAIDNVGNTITLRMPDGQVRTLRLAAQPVFIRSGHPEQMSRLHVGDTVYFEIPQGQNQIALLSDVGAPHQATISSVDNGMVTVTYQNGSKTETRSYAVNNSDIRFINQGQMVAASNFPNAFQQGHTVWVFGSPSNPSLLVSGVDRGFESAMIECPPTAGAAAAVTTAPPVIATAPETTTSSTTTEESTTTTTTPSTTEGTMPPETEGTMPSTTPSATEGTMPSTTMPSTMPATGIQFGQGTFQSFTAAQGDMPATVTVSYDWNGTPLMATYEWRDRDQWMSQGQNVSNWTNVAQGSAVTIPSNARLVSMTFGGTAGVGTITGFDQANNTVSLRLPNGDMSTLRYSPQAIGIQDNHPVMLSSLNVGDTVYFEIPPSGSQVALFTPAPAGFQGTVAAVGPDTITVQHPVNGRAQTNTYALSDIRTRFINNGQVIASTDMATAFQPGQTVWVYGPDTHPSLVASNVMGTGFQAASIEGAPATVATSPETTTTTTTTTTVPATTTVAMMAPPFDQGVVQSYTPAQGNMPAMAQIQFNWNGTPLTGSFIISPNDQWMAQGQPISDWTNVQAGTTVSIPASARLANLSFGGPMGVGVISAIDRTHNQISLRLPSGEMRTLRYSPQALVLSNGQPAMLSSLNIGDTVLFQVPPGSNQVALFQPVQPGIQGTVAQVGTDTITIQEMVNGQMVSRTYPITNTNTVFFSQGQQVASANIGTTFQPGQTVYIYGPAENPQFVASRVTTGYETAVVTPAATTAVAGSRQQVTRPARRPARRGVRPGK